MVVNDASRNVQISVFIKTGQNFHFWTNCPFKSVFHYIALKCNYYFAQSDLIHTIGESAALGAAGVVLWGSSEYSRSEVIIIFISQTCIIH